MEDDTYVDDVQYGGNINGNLKKFKEEGNLILKKERFTPYKWLSYIKSLDERQDNCLIQEDEQPMQSNQQVHRTMKRKYVDYFGTKKPVKFKLTF